MQLDIKTFQSAIASVLPFVPSRSSHPVLANVLLEPHFGDQVIRLTGFDLSMGVTLSIPAAVEIGEDAFTLPIKLLSDIVSKLSDGILTLEVAENVATIKTNSGSYRIRGMAPEEYPALSVVESGKTIEIPIADLLASLQPTMHSVSHEETKQVLTGVHFLAECGLLELAATDGHRLTVSSFDSDLDFEATVPGKFLNVLIKMIKASDAEMITIKIDAGMIEVEWASARLVSRLLEGQYPNYRQLIPKQFSGLVLFDRGEVANALDRISVLADQKNGVVNVSLAENLMTISVEAADVGSGVESIACQFDASSLNPGPGGKFSIAFSLKYLLGGLKALSTREVQISFNTPTSPIVITPLGGTKVEILLMPVQVRS